MNRRIVVTGTVEIVDDEIFENERCNHAVSGNVIIGEGQPSSLIRFSQCCGGEVRVEVDLNAAATSKGEVKVTGSAKLFEGASCETTDLEDEESIDFLVPVNDMAPFQIKLLSEGVGGGDNAKIRLNFANFPA